MDPCLSEEIVAALVDGELDGERFAAAERHISHCERCMRLVEGVGTAVSEARPVVSEGEPASTLGRGTVVGHFEVLEQIGAGGMGRVYAARDTALDRKVALKLLHAGAATADLEARLLREAKAMARLAHPEVITVYEVGHYGDQLFIAMELVEGGTLRQWLAARPRTWQETLEVCLRAGRGLARAHEAGIVHRDFKPDNVLVGEDGRVRVTDFGLARTGDSDEPLPPAGGAPSSTADTVLTRTGVLLGTPAYMAPEQHAGTAADARSDVYSFCVALYEALYGERPFTGGTVAALHAEKLGRRVQAPRTERRVPRRLRRALLVGLEPRAADRHATMDALLAALKRTARPQVWPLARAPAAALLGGGAIAVVGIAGVLMAIGWIALTASPSRPRAPLVASDSTAGPAPSGPSPVRIAIAIRDPRRLTFDDGCEEFPSLTPDGRSVVFDESFGDDAHVVVRDLASGAQRTLTKGKGWQFAPALSPDGTQVAYIDQAGERIGASVVPFDGSAPPRQVCKWQARPRWSPDGSALWCGSGRELDRIDVRTGAVTRTLQAPSGALLTEALELPDGRVFARRSSAESHTSTGLLRFDPGTAEPAEVIAGGIEETMALSPDGAHVLVSKVLATDQVDLWLVPLAGGAPVSAGDGAVQATKGLSVSRSGDSVVWSTCGNQGMLSVLGADKGTGRLQAQALESQVAWSDGQPAGIPADDTHVVVVSDRSGASQLWVLDVLGKGTPRALPSGGLEPSAPTVSPDGRWVAFNDGTRGIYLSPLDGSSAPRRLATLPPQDKPAFARDGRTLFFGTAGAGGAHEIMSISLVQAGEPTVLLANAARPSASPTSEALAYVVASGEGAGEPRILDLRTLKSRPLSARLGPGLHGFVRYSPDGRRIAVTSGYAELVELDARSGAEVRRFDAGDQIGDVTYVGARIVVTRYEWRGDLWMGRIEGR